MNQRPEKKELLADVFNETSAADFRDALLGETLRRVRNRRRWQQTRRAVGLLLTLGLLTIFFWQRGAKPTAVIAVRSTPKSVRLSYQLVRTEALPASAVVTTRTLARAQIITSTAGGDIVLTTRGNFRVINDEQLLALVAHRPAALIRVDANSERLVFADPADEKGFPVP